MFSKDDMVIVLAQGRFAQRVGTVLAVNGNQVYMKIINELFPYYFNFDEVQKVKNEFRAQ